MHEQHKCCSTESSTTEEKFLIETVMEQGKLAIPEKNEFENWNKSKKECFLEVWDHIESTARMKTRSFPIEESTKLLKNLVERLWDKLVTEGRENFV